MPGTLTRIRYPESDLKSLSFNGYRRYDHIYHETAATDSQKVWASKLVSFAGC